MSEFPFRFLAAKSVRVKKLEARKDQQEARKDEQQMEISPTFCRMQNTSVF